MNCNYLIRFLAVFMLTSASLLLNTSCQKEDNKVEDEIYIPKADQYLTWNFDASTDSIIIPRDSMWVKKEEGVIFIQAIDSLAKVTTPYASKSCWLAFREEEGGSLNFLSLGFLFNNVNYSDYYTQFQEGITVRITEYGDSTEYISGIYSGMIRDSLDLSEHPIRGAFRVKMQ
jgi:hypothetical protein